ncbi:MAG: hypothetical protein ACFE8B_11590 [Candidatus Hermodarchaeota archaeon]
MKNENLEEELKRFRTQARSRVIVLISSLILIFLWFTDFSWITQHATFSSMALAAAGRSLGMRISHVISVTFIITILFTIFYILLLKVLISASIEN